MPAVKFNLLPADLAPKESIIKLSNNLKKISVIGYSLFIVAGLASAAFFFYLSNEVSKASSTTEQYKQSISSLEKTEQKLILIRDRVEKAEKILKTSPTEKRIDSLKVLSASFPDEITFTNVEIFPDRLDLTILASNSQALKEGMAELTDSGLFKKVEMISFGLNPKSGYLVTLQVF
ncbi:hypothetical protein IID21_02915 [Patescibacteria group bacterium]|nr:hypothetical protein [Patescibacteria group bacterium]